MRHLQASFFPGLHRVSATDKDSFLTISCIAYDSLIPHPVRIYVEKLKVSLRVMTVVNRWNYMTT